MSETHPHADQRNDTGKVEAGGIDNERLINLVERIETNQAQIDELKSHERDLYKGAKSAGFDVKAIRQIIRERKKDADEVEEFETLVATYKRALGMLDGTPLGDAAVRSASTRRGRA
jgi:uncharacterized protein (UPF0335 family)